MYLYPFKAMIIIAWNGSGDLSGIFQGDVFLKVLSIFITAAILKLAQGDDLSTYTTFLRFINNYLTIYTCSVFFISIIANLIHLFLALLFALIIMAVTLAVLSVRRINVTWFFFKLCFHVVSEKKLIISFHSLNVCNFQLSLI